MALLLQILFMMLPVWQNSLLIANLKKGTVSRYKLSNDGQSIIYDTIHYFRGLGRFRDVVASPEGLKIYIACVQGALHRAQQVM